MIFRTKKQIIMEFKGTKDFIEKNRIYLTDLSRNNWEVAEISDVEIFGNELEDVNKQLLEALQEIRKWYEANHDRYLGEYTPVCFSKGLSAINKALE